jgi:hypothetical protein
VPVPLFLKRHCGRTPGAEAATPLLIAARDAQLAREADASSEEEEESELVVARAKMQKMQAQVAAAVRPFCALARIVLQPRSQSRSRRSMHTSMYDPVPLMTHSDPI